MDNAHVRLEAEGQKRFILAGLVLAIIEQDPKRYLAPNSTKFKRRKLFVSEQAKMWIKSKRFEYLSWLAGYNPAHLRRLTVDQARRLYRQVS